MINKNVLSKLNYLVIKFNALGNKFVKDLQNKVKDQAKLQEFAELYAKDLELKGVGAVNYPKSIKEMQAKLADVDFINYQESIKERSS